MSAQLNISKTNSEANRQARHRPKPTAESISEVKEMKVKPSASIGSIPVVLTDHKSFIPWRDYSEIHHKSKHGELTNLFHTGINHTIDKPARPPRVSADDLRAMTKEEKDDLQYEKEEYSTLYREWVREMSYIKRQSALFFGDIMLTISKTALDKLKENRK